MPSVRFLLCSAIVQQVHLLLQVAHYGTRCPPYVTLTDGGLVETIGVVELLRRRCRWIIIMDAGEDPKLIFVGLSKALQLASDEGLVSPFRSVHTDAQLRDCLDRSVKEHHRCRLYATYRDGSRVDVFLVKMRYPSHDTPCQPLISPDEVRRGESSYEVTQILNPETYKVPDVTQRSINGLCCDCCHGCCAKGPCGRFPFLGVGNQFLTPLQYANLARLGHDLAAAPLAELVEARAAATRRKSSPAAALISRKRAEASECADCPLLSSRF